MIICRCDGTINGIFTAIYRAWEIGTTRTKISIADNDNLELFAEYMDIEADEAIAAKVADSVKRKISIEAYEQVYHAALSADADRADAIYRFLIVGFRYAHDVINMLANPYVRRIFELNRNVSREAHNYLGFIRFCQCHYNNSTLLLARFDPRNNIIDMVSHHFADRLMHENWLIVDTKRNICSLHNAGSRYYISHDIPNELLEALVRQSLEDFENKAFEELWETFRSSVTIESRRNEALQQQLMPLRYRTYMNNHP